MSKIIDIFNRFLCRIKGEAIFLYGSRIGAISLQSLSLFIIAATIDIEEFGRFTFILSASQIASVVLGVGSQGYLQRILPAREVSYSGEGNTNIVAVCLARSFLLTSLSACLFYFYEWRTTGSITLHLNEEPQLILITGFLLSCLHILVSVVRVAQSATYGMLVRDLFPYLFFLIGFFFFRTLGYSSAEVFILNFCGALVVCVLIALLSTLTYLRARATKTKFHNPQKGAYVTFWGGSIAATSFHQADMLVARLLLNDSELGIYALLRRVSNLISMPQIIANWSINVKVATDFELGNKVGLQEHATHGLILSLPAATLLFTIIGFSFPIWIKLFHLTPATSLLALLLILLIAQLGNVLAGANLLFALQCRQEGFELKSRILSLIVGLISMFIGGLKFGSIGIALGVLISIFMHNLIVLVYVKRTTGVWTSIPITCLFKKM